VKSVGTADEAVLNKVHLKNPKSSPFTVAVFPCLAQQVPDPGELCAQPSQNRIQV
jgi:hypothetical protein